MPLTVFIAPPEHLTFLQGRPEFGQVQAFADADALKALEAIMRTRPQTVVLERTFAGTSRGAALINRIKADPVLATCEIRIVVPGSGAGRAAADAGATAAQASPPEAAPAQASLDQRGTRRSPRMRIADGVEVLLDGNPATLVDLSVDGAQVLSLTVLKPNQRVRMQLPTALPPLRLIAAVAWAAFEIPQSGPRYRAGMAFVGADVAAVMRFIDQHKRQAF